MHIHIVHVEPASTLGIAGTSRRELERREEKTADHFRRHGVGSSWTLRFGSQQDHLLDQARVVSADLLCLGMVHRPTDPSQMGALSSIIRAAKCPILTVPGAA
jgi:nucleotide-binding universal stress UspA family protein